MRGYGVGWRAFRRAGESRGPEGAGRAGLLGGFFVAGVGGGQAGVVAAGGV